MAVAGPAGTGISGLQPWAKFKDELCATAKAMSAPGKGLLASDESSGTVAKRLAQINLEASHENQVKYRELLYTTEGLGDHISGAIIFEGMLEEKTRDGKPFVAVLQEKGIIPGIKVDSGLKELPGGGPGEKMTAGLDSLAAKCSKAYGLGARFAKWRNVLIISEKDNLPSNGAIFDCVTTLAKYAMISQSEGLVPIVEPEIMLDGNHSLETARKVHEKVWSLQYQMLEQFGVLLEGSVLKPSMIVPGADLPKADAETVAKVTVDTLMRCVPAAVPGILFLSGGQSEEEATQHIQAMNTYKKCPWSLTFSFGRALQASVLKTWSGKDENFKAAQDMLYALSKANGLANIGEYKPKDGKHPSTGGLGWARGSAGHNY